MEVGRSIFRAIADFSEVRSEARKTKKSLDNMVKTTKGVTGILTRAVGSFAKGVMKLGAGVAVIGAASAGLISLTAAALGVVGGLAPLAGLGVILPGLLAGLAVGGLAFALAMKDAKTELAELAPLLTAVQKAASSNFWAKAAQPIRDLGQTLLPQVATGMATVGSAMGALTAKFATALSGYLDGAPLATMFNQTAAGIDNASTGAKAFAEIIKTLGLTGSAYLPRMGQWFADLTNRFNNFLQAAAGRGQLEIWAENGLRVLRELGTVISSVSSILNSLFKAAENAAPGSALTVMAGALERFAEVLKRPEVQSGITNVFAAAHSAMDYVQAGLSQIGAGIGALEGTFSRIMLFGGQAFGMLLGYIGQIMQTEGLGSGIDAFLQGVLDGVALLGPAIGPLGELLAALGPLAGEVARTVGQLLGEALTFLVPILTDVAKTLTPIAPYLVAIAAGAALALAAFNLSTVGLIVLAIIALVMAISWLVQNWDQVVAFASQVWGGFLNWCKEVTDGFVNWWNQLWGGFGNLIGEIWGGFVNWIIEIWDGFVSWIMGGVNGFFGWWNGVWAGFAGFMTDTWNLMVSTIQAIWAPIAAFFALIWTAIQTAAAWFFAGFMASWNALMAFLAPLFAMFDAMFRAFGAALDFLGALTAAVIAWMVAGWLAMQAQTNATMAAIWATISGIWNSILSFITTVLTAIGQFVLMTWTAIVDWISAALSTVWGFVSSTWNQIMGFLGSVLAAIGALISGTWNFIVAVVSGALAAVWGFVSSVWNQIMGFIGSVLGMIGSLVSSGWNTVVSFVSDAMGRVWTAVVDGWNRVTGWLGGIGGMILGAIGDLGGILFGAGQSILQGLLDGLKSMWDGVAGFFGDLTASIPDWKGPKKVDKKLLTNAGQLVLGGFLKGLESMYGTVRKSLGGFTDSLGGTVEIDPDLGGGGFDPGALMGGFSPNLAPDLSSNVSATNVLNETPTAITYEVKELNVNNPKPERASESLPRVVRKLGYVGVGSNA